MVRRLLPLFAVAACAPTVLAQAVVRPPGGDGYFGTPQNQAFTPDVVFKGPPPAAAAVPLDPPAILPVQPAGPDGGLLPPPPPPPPPIWSGSADLGLNGASGNSDLFNARVGLEARRKTELNAFTTDFLYQLAEQNGLTTTNQALWNARDEVLFAGSPWSVFGALNLEYDELRAYDFRVGVYGGVGYIVVDNADVTFKLRGGAGAVREVNTRDPLVLPAAQVVPGFVPAEDRWVPEFVLGYDFRYRVNDRSSFLSILDYYPRVDDLSQFRVRVRAAYENVLDPANGIVLRLGVQNRYDSNPGNAKKNDLTYFASLGLKF